MPCDLCVLLFGDPVQDEYILPQRRLGGLDRTNDAQDWQHHDQWVRLVTDGGVDMTADMLRAYGPSAVHVAELVGQEHESPSLTSLVEIQKCSLNSSTARPEKFVNEQVQPHGIAAEERASARAEDERRNARYRVSRFLGYSGMPRSKRVYALPKDYIGPPNAIVLNDAGNVLRHSKACAKENAFVGTLASINSETDLVLKMHLPLMQGLVWSEFVGAVTAKSRVAIVMAEDLRETGMALSRCPSWDQMMTDIAKANGLANLDLEKLREGSDLLIVLFDVEGALVIEKGRLNAARLIYSPGLAEGATAASVPGDIVGTMNSFLVQFVLDYVQRSAESNIDSIVKRALGAAHMFTQSGYRRVGTNLVYPEVPQWVNECDNPDHSREWPVYHTTTLNLADKHPRQRIDLLRQALAPNSTGGGLHDAYCDKARKIVLNGRKSEVGGLPHGKFGKLQSVDPDEIQALRAIDALIQNYLQDASRSKPLSLAVFGPPGSGKSFGVKQLVDARKTPIREYNLSQASEADLPGFFHEIRDLNLKGALPLCFFDEFDSNNRSLLKSFLAPMQDGVFLEGEALRPIGRGIFVFAGGTTATFEDFSRYSLWQEDWSSDEERQNLDAKSQKLPDFISRLQGFLNVKGPNPVPVGGEVSFEDRSAVDPAYILRRAILLRQFIEDNLAGIINHATKEAAIAPKLLNALLMVQDYKHGARSMELLIKAMVRGNGQRKLDRSHLPIDALVSHYVSPLETFRVQLH